MSKTVFTQTNVDYTTGEITSSKVIKKTVQNTDMFIRTYIQDIGALAKCSGAEQSVILCSFKYIDYNTNILYIDSVRRNDISICSNLKLNTVNTAIARLVKKNILIKQSSSAYLLNPKLFFFGTDMEREKILTLSIQYTIIDNQ